MTTTKILNVLKVIGAAVVTGGRFIRNGWRDLTPGARLLLKLGGNVVLFGWGLHYAAKAVAAFDANRFVHAYPRLAVASAILLATLVPVGVLVLGRTIEIVWPAARGRWSWTEAGQSVLRYWLRSIRVVGYMLVFLAAAMLSGLVGLPVDLGQEPKWLVTGAVFVFALQLGIYVGRVIQRRRELRRDEIEEEDVDRACLNLRHRDCPHLEDGPIDPAAGAYERVCCCGISVDTRTALPIVTVAAGKEPV